MALTEQQLVALARRHQDQLLSVRDRAVTVIDRLWERIATNPSQDALGRWLDAAVPVVQSASETAATASLAYVPTYVAGAGETPRGAELAVTQFLRPRGVDLADVLTRPFVTMRTALANGDTMDRARQIAGARARQIAATDPLLAARAASSAAMRSDPSIVGYRRVPDAGACAFCRLAATQRYRDGDLMAMHSSCGCTVAPIIGDRDPGQIIDRDALRSLKADGVIDEISLRRYISSTNDVVASYEAKAREWRERARLADSQADETRYAKRADDWAAKARGRAADVEQARARLRAVQSGRLDRLTAVHEHGELGPVLYPAGVEFTAA
ncbi:hypothetical protein UFOVP314_31 [uncultured Caudovirales phage]|uniref:Capsid maturation protease n=1 Tax=uncultured Caudovirales phage TaxID=2100421 RepID=A0A6J5LT02_9CAUD|nr:hypothetical protein UFOVP314_31 [uncultured Caudovirales phage]